MFAAGLLLTSVVLLASAQPPAQAPPPPSGLIVGRVVDATSGRPVPGAIVALQGAPTQAGPPRAMTNASGQFVFRRLAKGSYSFTAMKSGYVDGAYGRRTPGGTPTTLVLDDGQRVTDLTIRIWRVASIGGTVTDEAGEALATVQVRAYQRRYVSGTRRLVQMATASTDDRGVYRFGSLAPGEYLVAFMARDVSMPVSLAELARNPNQGDPKTTELLRDRFAFGGISASPVSPNTIEVDGFLRQIDPSAPIPPAAPGGAVFIYPAQFFPGVPSAARAAVIALGAGQQRDNVDFTLRPVPAARISGTVVGPDGPAGGMALRLIPADGTITDMETAGALSSPDGAFAFFGVPSGEYTIKTFRVPQPPRPPSTVTQMQVG
jgi:protocatechuate 3,4-dioxygenase beta subunit